MERNHLHPTAIRALSAIPDAFTNPQRKPTIALIRGLGEGEFMQRYLTGAQAMADQFGFVLRESTAPNLAAMAELLETACRQQVDAIVLSHGPPDILLAPINRALEAGIMVVTFDLVVDNANVPEIEQDDMLIGFLLCQHLATECNGTAEVLYINTDTFAPLVKRDRAWQDFMWRYRGLHQLAHCAPMPSNVAADTYAHVRSLLDQHPEINVVLALWDEYAKGAVRAITQVSKADTIRVYSVDITDEDIQLMTADGSPWVATVATDAYTVGRLAVRAAAALIAGEQLNKYLLIEPHLITQGFLRSKHITNMEELVEVLPSLGESQLGWFDWMEVLLERNGHPMPRIGQWAEAALQKSEAQLREVVEQQQQLIATIRELSTPVMPVHDGILVLPLIGNVDSERSRQIMEALLTSVQQQQAELIIIDITGVPIVDTAVANHLIQAIRAVGLLGAQCVLVGISPEVAQTVVQLGLDLSHLVTRSNLQTGIAYALARRGLALTPRMGSNGTSAGNV